MRMKLKALVLLLGLGLGMACGSGGENTSPAPPITITLNPVNVSLVSGSTQSFTATVTGAKDPGIMWSIQEGVGSGSNPYPAGLITFQGVYTAPSTPGTYHVVAASSEDSKKSASATVTVSALPPRRLSLVAGGTGGLGSADGMGSSAGFNGLEGIALDLPGNLYVADTANHIIRKISPSGIVTTLAGSVGRAGNLDGMGSAARFHYPAGLAMDGNGNVLVADSANSTIRKISPSGSVTTIAGSPGQNGSVDGAGVTARFSSPHGIACDVTGNIYIADTGNDTLRKISTAGLVSTLVGAPGQKGSVDGIGSDARFWGPENLALDGTGNIFVTDWGNHTLRKVSPSGQVSTLAGLAGSPGSTDGNGGAARFHSPEGIALDAQGNLFVGDRGNTTIRRITPSGEVSTYAGRPGYWGSLDGPKASALLGGPWGVAVDPAGAVYFSDPGNTAIRRISPEGEVSTLAGSAPSRGYVDGPGASARFWGPTGVAVDGVGNTYVADEVNQVIRKITPGGEVSVWAGVPGAPGYSDGPTPLFNYPEGVAVDGGGTVFVADSGNHIIRKISSTGAVSTLAGSPGVPGSADGVGPNARFNSPSGVAVDTSGNVYVADTNNYLIRKITPSGVVSTLAGTLLTATGPSDFASPWGVAVDGSGNVYVVDGWSVIRKITSSGVVSTIAGTRQENSFKDGIWTSARFWYPKGIAVDALGTLYMADWGNDVIRQISPTGVVSTIAGRPGIPGIVVDQAPGGLSAPWGIALAPNGDLVISTSQAIVRAVKP